MNTIQIETYEYQERSTPSPSPSPPLQLSPAIELLLPLQLPSPIMENIIEINDDINPGPETASSSRAALALCTPRSKTKLIKRLNHIYYIIYFTVCNA